ncbi:hypothetical protein NUW58_g10520 [Xylaria curta]|uniref:Uncharacterized protein n=1 Tax=Xylaria curta TaxID=42375 RepID=A0ACC1MKB2_9PEZI|nr:hypothetical protein NUW58_g10520 [Xylaria curta]
MATAEETPVPLPSAPVVQLAGNATLQPPLTRRGYGPGLIIILPGDPSSTSETDPNEQQESGNAPESRSPKTLDPLPREKWAEEGYAVVQLIFGNGLHGPEEWSIGTTLDKAIETLETLETCNVKDKFGLIGKRAVPAYCLFSYALVAYSSMRLIAEIQHELEPR